MADVEREGKREGEGGYATRVPVGVRKKGRADFALPEQRLRYRPTRQSAHHRISKVKVFQPA